MGMSMADSRHEFEAWAKARSLPLDRLPNDEYAGYQVHTAWLCWQHRDADIAALRAERDAMYVDIGRRVLLERSLRAEVAKVRERCSEWALIAGEHGAEKDSLRAEVERLKQERDTFYMDYRMKCDAQTKSLHAEVERLRKDAERWRSAVDDYAAGVIQGYDPKTNTHFGYVSRFVEAIQERDAAMRQEPKA